MSNAQASKYFYLLVFLPFLPIIWPTGVFQESDFAFFGLWFVAGLYAFFLGFGKNDTIKVPVLASGFFLLAALSVFGIVQNGLTTLGGINEIREGTATFLAMAILLIVGKQADFKNIPLWVVPVAYGILTIAGCRGWLNIKTYIFLDIAAFPLLASVPMYVHFRKSIKSLAHLWNIFYLLAFLFLLDACDNKAVTVACLCALIFVYLLPLAKEYLNFLPKKDGWYIVIGLVFIAMMILFSYLFLPILPAQLQSRSLLGIVSVSHYFDNFSFSKFFHLLFGYGWGSYQEFPVLNLFRLENFSMYADGNFKPNWEFLERNLLHSHNLILETLVSNGLLGVGLLLTIVYKWVENIDLSDLSSRFFVVSYLILLSAWFQTPPVLIFSFLAMSLMKEKVSHSFKIPASVFIGCGLFLTVFSCAELWSSLVLNQHRYKTIQSFEKDVSKFLNHPAHSYDKFSTYKCSNRIIGEFSYGLSTARIIDDKYLPDIEKSVICLAKDYLGSYQKRNVVSSVLIINLCNTYVSLSKVNILKNPELFNIFKAVVVAHVANFPERADMAIGFLNLCFDKMENMKETADMANIVLETAPGHPVGLWFKGLSGLSLGIEKKQSLEKMQLAIKKGLCRFMPIPKELLKSMGVYQEAIGIDRAAKVIK